MSAVAHTPVRTGATRTPHARAAVGLVVIVAVLFATCIASICVGARGIPLDKVWTVIWHPDGSEESIIVHDLRIPRTILGLLVGMALGVAGGVMQAVTRNPLADPGLLGVNAGASAAVVTATAVIGTMSPLGYIWFAFAGAALASIIVYGVGAAGRSGATPVRLALAGTALSFALFSYVYAVILIDRAALNEFRYWQVGAIAGQPESLNWQIMPFIGAGLLLAFALARPLNAIALGEDAGRALGAKPGQVRALGAVSITLLCGTATAAAGPIVFIGLTVPHVARAICGPDQRWVMPYCALLAPVFLLGSDIIGRVVTRPGELEVGVVSAMLGAPVFIAIVRHKRIAQL